MCGIAGFIGIDGGSTSTKAVLMSKDHKRRILAKTYQLSKGNPIQDTIDLFENLRDQHLLREARDAAVHADIDPEAEWERACRGLAEGAANTATTGGSVASWMVAVDDTTVVFEFQEPNFLFVDILAGSTAIGGGFATNAAKDLWGSWSAGAGCWSAPSPPTTWSRASWWRQASSPKPPEPRPAQLPMGPPRGSAEVQHRPVVRPRHRPAWASRGRCRRSACSSRPSTGCRTRSRSC